MKVIDVILEWSIIIIPLISSIFSFILFFMKKIKNRFLITILPQFILVVFLPLFIFSYTYHLIFLNAEKMSDITFFLNDLYSNSKDAIQLLILVITQIFLTVCNVIICIKTLKNKWFYVHLLKKQFYYDIILDTNFKSYVIL